MGCGLGTGWGGGLAWAWVSGMGWVLAMPSALRKGPELAAHSVRVLVCRKGTGWVHKSGTETELRWGS